MSDKMTVLGLSAARDKMVKLSAAVQLEESRNAMLQSLLVITRRIKATTYTTGFKRITGFTKSGFGVRVYKPKGESRVAYIVQYPQNISGAQNATVRKYHTPAAKGGKQSLFNVAYWWRFLEIGTNGRKSARTPKAAKLGRIQRKINKRSARALARYNAAPSLGDLQAHPWVRPAFASTRENAVLTFSTVFKTGIDKAAKR